MKPINSIAGLSALGLTALALALSPTVARAQVSGSLWENVSSDQADQSLPTATPDMTFTSAGIDFQSQPPGSYTMGGFLNSEIATTYVTGASHAGDSMSTGTGNTLFDFTGTIYLNAGANSFTIGHDDGIDLTVAGVGFNLDDAGPTSFTPTSFTINAATAGDYTYNLEYMECCNPPADLEWAYPNGLPVGAPDGGTTMTLLGGAFAALAGFARRLRK